MGLYITIGYITTITIRTLFGKFSIIDNYPQGHNILMHHSVYITMCSGVYIYIYTHCDCPVIFEGYRYNIMACDNLIIDMYRYYSCSKEVTYKYNIATL